MILCLTAMMSVLTMSAQSIYDFNVKNDAGEEVSLEAYKGKVLLIVNTATRCGFTPQYEGRNKDDNVVKRFPPTTTPEEIDAEIAKLL